METETIVMSSRRRMVLKPLSAPAATLQCKVQNTSNDTNEYDKVSLLYTYAGFHEQSLNIEQINSELMVL